MTNRVGNCDRCGASIGHSHAASDEARAREILVALLGETPESFGYDSEECPRGWRLALVQHCLEARYGIVLPSTQLRRVLAELGYDFSRRKWRPRAKPPQPRR